MAVKHVIIDCDPSADDALALMLALPSPELKLLGITAVSGVCHVRQSTANAVKILELYGRTDIPVAAGAQQPLVHHLEFDQAYCGADGLSETGLPPAATPVHALPAALFIRECVRQHPGDIHIISTAPMTNIAMAFCMFPEIKKDICSIITSSGSYGVGQALHQRNPRPTWNILTDPEAAKIVMESGVLIEAVGFDISSRFSNPMVEELLAVGGPQRPAKEFFQRAVAFNQRNGLEPYSLLVDSVAVAYAIAPEIAKMTAGKVAVETKGELTRGQTIFGNIGYLDHMNSRIRAAYDFDQKRFIQLLAERVFG